MKVSQVLDQITIAYSKKDTKELKEYLKEIERDHYCFNFEPNLYQFRIRPNIKPLKKKNRTRNSNKYIGIVYIEKHDKYTANIKINKKTVYLGQADTDEEAAEIRREYIEKNGLKGYKLINKNYKK